MNEQMNDQMTDQANGQANDQIDDQVSRSLAEVPNFPITATKPSAAHSRRCSVCHHPDRIWIELKFIEWNSPTRIAREYGLYDRDSIYHHAHATGLFEQRRRNILCLYENLLERTLRTRITNRGIMLAIDRLERAARSRLPDPATEIETTLTRDAELVFDPKSISEAHQAANSDSAQRQHTPTDVPDSKQPATPKSRQPFRDYVFAPDDPMQRAFLARREAIKANMAKARQLRGEPPV
jgi:hypothetical protein